MRADLVVAIALIGFAAAIVVLLAAGRWRCAAKRRRLLGAAFPGEWEEIMVRNVPLYRVLPDELRRQLRPLVSLFVGTKRFEGCGGLEITDEIKVTIAAQACMLLLNRETNLFRRLTAVLVYPSAYIARHEEGRDVRLGESWRAGPVVLAWDSVIGAARNLRGGSNVVLHEFSHQLDQEDGEADGAPILERHSCYKSWARVLGAEYEKLRSGQMPVRHAVLDEYGAVNPAEFFAVATEAFFEKPGQMKQRHAELYEELKNYYKLDPAAWE
jgi:Mlc titration factor MtfA (ptsG expression regulator)